MNTSMQNWILQKRRIVTSGPLTKAKALQNSQSNLAQSCRLALQTTAWSTVWETYLDLFLQPYITIWFPDRVTGKTPVYSLNMINMSSSRDKSPKMASLTMVAISIIQITASNQTINAKFTFSFTVVMEVPRLSGITLLSTQVFWSMLLLTISSSLSHKTVILGNLETPEDAGHITRKQSTMKMPKIIMASRIKLSRHSLREYALLVLARRKLRFLLQFLGLFH